MSVASTLEDIRSKEHDIDKYLYLRNLQRQREPEFYSLLVQHTEEILPYVYTPTVGEACQRYHHLPLVPRGLYLDAGSKDDFLALMRAWPQQEVRHAHFEDHMQIQTWVVVVTDGERILGLGDLGTGGMGIAEGKILLYTAAAGVDPRVCLPVFLDVGTNNESLLKDPLYKGIRKPRLRGGAYHEVVANFMAALRQWQPHVLVQFEDFANHNAFELLNEYRANACVFNDDIQGTACITLAGLLSALRATGKSLTEQRILFYGAGEAGTGIAELIAIALERRHGLTREEARQHCLFMDSKGLVCASRTDLQPHKLPFAHDHPFQRGLLDAVNTFRPTALIGVSAVKNAFTPDVVQAMSSINERPIIFPLSNPTSKAECTFEEAFKGSAGSVLFASGSPFPPINTDGVTQHAAQANNAYVFPAIGFAAVLTRASTISDEVFLAAAEMLSHMTTLEELSRGIIFPRFSAIQTVSASLTAAVAEQMVRAGEGKGPPRPAGQSAWEAYVRSKMFKVPLQSKL
ncbi:cytosolic NADP malic enzyme [Coccomyxa subellipsoidea C-169]|uniref:Malic enzyme n=1 Tax=Coccomyxa subellipsoidea (strain C-169) TaxID=574566 RepID=I0ZAC7_COCSC|nr:cytosolic NADP malic enzyme [Coccomyxa subellipsoidea C-169]EIE27596.1 cytosolic NADP malic enzyme [Coccomyxa subellipsoidea C-169]|eukprot:XP_005652140.1 cytosolic NADP malic enzyme [Coccomyxa subellipsoidea C-169]